jgi:hypothetical protein
MSKTIAWLAAEHVQLAFPKNTSLRRVRQLMKASDLAHWNGTRLYADRLEQFVVENFYPYLAKSQRPRTKTAPVR